MLDGPAVDGLAPGEEGPYGAAVGPMVAPVDPASVPGPVPGRRRRFGAAMAVGLVGLAVILAGVGWLATRDGGGGRAGGPLSTAPPTAGSAGPSGATEPGPASPSSAPSTGPRSELSVPATSGPPSSPPPSADPPGEAAHREAVDRYYQLVRAGDLEASWARLSPRFQSEQGYEDYVGYWTGTIASVEVRGRPRVDLDQRQVALTLRYTRTDGVRTTEEVVLDLVDGPGGQLLIDDYTVVASRR